MQDDVQDTYGLSVVIPTRNEPESLAATLLEVMNLPAVKLREILLVLAKDATTACRTTAEHFVRKHPNSIRLIEQENMGLGNAIRLGISSAHGTHVAILYADFESDPSLLKAMYVESITHPAAIINASRWLKGGKFLGYSRSKLVLNWLAQIVTRCLFGFHVTDFTFGYRLYPKKLFEILSTSENGHSIQYDIIIKAIKTGCEIRELPTIWRTRIEEIPTGTLSVYLPNISVAFRHIWQRPSLELMNEVNCFRNHCIKGVELS